MNARRQTRPAGTTASLHLRLGGALLAAGIVLALGVLAASAALATVRERQDQVVDLYFDAVSEAESAYARVVDAEIAVRGYLLTGDAAILETLASSRAAYDRFEDGGAVLEAALGSDHEVVASHRRALEAAQAWFDEFADPVTAEVAVGGPDTVSPEDLERGGILFDEVRTALEDHTALLSESRAEAAAGLDRATAVLVAAFAVLVVSAVLAGALLWVFLSRWVTFPLADLAADARLVAGGDVLRPVRAAGPGEVGAVARDVELMRARLAELLGEAAQARAELERSHALLQEQAEDLRRSNRDLEQFAYVASHDLQEPLRKVASFTQLLARRYEGQLDERADQYIGFAVDGARRMQRLINDLLGFSRVGRSGGQAADVPLDRVLEQVLADLQAAVEESGATVTSDPLPVVRGEEALLAQLLMNLLGNALKFRAADRPPVVHLGAALHGDRWELTLSDNGIGIDQQYADRVFIIFQRLHAQGAYDGTGIGLALCKKIVEHHGGEIEVVATPGPGTTFRFTLPAGSSERVSAASPAQTSLQTDDAPAPGGGAGAPAPAVGTAPAALLRSAPGAQGSDQGPTASAAAVVGVLPAGRVDGTGLGADDGPHDDERGPAGA